MVQRGKDNHCACLGAWSLYQAQKNKSSSPDSNNKVLKCDAIPKVALSQDYVSKFSEGWNKWNGLELNEQIKDGVEGLIQDCYQPEKNPEESEELKKIIVILLNRFQLYKIVRYLVRCVSSS